MTNMFSVTKKSPQPLFEQIKAGLRAQVESGRLKAGECLLDENVLAKQLRVSHMTVRRAVVELSREGLFKRVSGKGTFVRERATRSDRARQTQQGTIAIVTTHDPMLPGSFFYFRMLQNLLIGLEPLRLTPVFRTIKEPLSEFAAELDKDASLRAVVLIWAGDTKVAEQLSRLSAPTIILDSVQPEPAMFDEVGHDGENGMFTAVNFLAKLGHRAIGLVQSEHTNRITVRRQMGYERALKANSIEVDPARIVPVIFSPELAYATIRGLLGGPRAPTALVCASDGLALGAIAAVTEHGWRVPRDMSIVGYGDEGYFSVPQLSTVRAPLEQMGLAAAKLVAERLERPAGPPRRVVFQSEWISRASCDCPRTAPPAHYTFGKLEP